MLYCGDAAAMPLMRYNNLLGVQANGVLKPPIFRDATTGAMMKVTHPHTWC